MKITCGNNLKIESGQAVKMIAKHLYKNLGGAYKFESHANMCDVYFIVLYEVPRLQKWIGKADNPEEKKEYNALHEMKINLNITTYQNKVRVNLIEITPQERTLGYDCYKPELIQLDIIAAREKIWDKVKKRLEKEYQDYDFAF